MSAPPIMVVEKKVRIWQFVRLPIIIFAIAVAVAAITLSLFFLIRSANIKRSVAESRKAVTEGTYGSYTTGLNTLKTLLANYPDRVDVLSTTAWAYVYGAYAYHGKSWEGMEKSRQLLSRIPSGKDHDLRGAAMGLRAILEDRGAEAVTLTGESLQIHKGCDELKFVHGLALASTGKTMEAVIDLELLHSRSKPFVPAMIEIAKLKRAAKDHQGSLTILLEVLQFQDDNLAAQIEAAHLQMQGGAANIPVVEKRIGTIQSALKDAPPSVMARGLLAVGVFTSLKGQFDVAVDPLEKAYAIDPEDDETVLALSRAYRMAGRPLTAVKILAKVADLKRVPTGTLVEMTESGLATGRVKLARAAVGELLLRADFESPKANYLAGVVEMQSKNPEKAVSHFKASGESADSRIQMALALARSGKLPDAGKLLKDMSKNENQLCATLLYAWLTRKGPQALDQTANLAACPFAIKAPLLLEAGRYAQLSELATQEAKLAETPETLYYLAASAWRTLGLKIAHEEMDKILTFEPDGVQLLSDVAAAFLAMGRLDEALQAAQMCYDKNPDAAAAHALLAATLSAIQKGDQADKIINAAAAAFPDTPAVLIEKARRLAAGEKFAEAAAILQPLLTRTLLAEEMAEAGVLLAGVDMAMKNDNDAEDALLEVARAIARDYDPAASLDVYATLISLKIEEGGKKNLMKAKGIFNVKSKEPIPSAKLLFEGGRILLAEGEKEAAVELIIQALAADPAFKPAYVELKSQEALNEAHRQNFERIFEETL
jgi:tetratricopeptide (TPR) repeat protein